jgi:amidase
MKFSEYAKCDGLGLARLVRAGEVSAEELRDVALSAIHKLNPKLNAVVGLTSDEAERAIRERNVDAPFSGVPFLIKDVGMHYANVPTEMGSRFTRGVVLPYDSELAARFKRAGVVTLGRTNTPEFGANASTEPLANGPTRNPWNLECSPGGSSGGSAAAVAAGLVPLAHGNDGGGSIRIPAAYCGLFGLKPSRYRVPWGPDADDGIFGLGCELVLSRTVRDTAAMLDATHGADVGARYLLPNPPTTYLAACGKDPGRLRIAFTSMPPDGAPQMHVDCRQAVADTAKLCEELGHEVFEAKPEVTHEESWSIFRDVAGAYLASSLRALSAVIGRKVDDASTEAGTRALLEHGARLTAADLSDAIGRVNLLSRKLGRFFESCDVWLSPTVNAPSVRLGVLNQNAEGLDASEWCKRIFDTAPYTAMFNASGQPAMSVPLCTSRDGLPVGVHFAGRFADEFRLLALAAQLERARPWIGRAPQHSVYALG